MKALKTIGVLAFGTALAALAAIPSANARSFRGIGNIWVDSNMCTADLETQLSSRGFGVTSRERSADAILEVDMRHVPDHVGHSYRYTATLRDADDGHVLMRASDQETSLIMSKVCPSIGDDVADDIESRTG